MSFPLEGIIATCFPCITYGRVKRRYEHLNNKGYPDPDQGGIVSSDCLIHACLTSCGVGWILQVNAALSLLCYPEYWIPVTRWELVLPSGEDTLSRAGVAMTVASHFAALLANLPRNRGNWNWRNVHMQGAREGRIDFMIHLLAPMWCCTFFTVLNILLKVTCLFITPTAYCF